MAVQLWSYFEVKGEIGYPENTEHERRILNVDSSVLDFGIEIDERLDTRGHIAFNCALYGHESVVGTFCNPVVITSPNRLLRGL